MKPPLSTVYQNFYDVSKMAVRKALSYLQNDGNFTTCTLNAEFLARESCGCVTKHDSDVDKEDLPFSDKVEGQRIIDHLKVDNILSSLLIRNLLTE
jgi:hypothetical protein